MKQYLITGLVAIVAVALVYKAGYGNKVFG